MRRLFLDDNTQRHQIFSLWYPDAFRVTTIADLLSALDGERFDEIWLDHDLQEVPGNTVKVYGTEKELTGQDAAVHVARLPDDKKPTQVVIHSWNPPGASLMYQILRDAGVRAVKAPFEYE